MISAGIQMFIFCAHFLKDEDEKLIFEQKTKFLSMDSWLMIDRLFHAKIKGGLSSW